MHIIEDLRNNLFQEINNRSKILNILGLRLFQLGILLLALAPILAIFILIISSILASIYSKENYFKDKYNYPFLLISVIMIINCILLSTGPKIIDYPQVSNAWVGLLNWIPFFWCFWSFQKYLNSIELRLITAKLLVLGSIPVLISGFCQYFLGIYGPFRFLNDLIIWYQRPLGSDNGVTGIFNNQNYAGAWLCILLPLCFGFLLKENKNWLKKLLTFLLSINFIYMIILTSSRNAILSIFIAIFLFTKSIKTKFYSALALVSIPLFIYNLPLTYMNNQNKIFNFIPFELIKKTSIDNIPYLFSSPRVEIWSKAIKLIESNLLVGYGAGSFGYFYNESNGFFKGIQHSHNLFLEIAFSHGLISAIIIISFFTYLTIVSSKILNISFKENFVYLRKKVINFDKAWIISFVVFFLIHIFDITYFDGRISIISWVLLAGMTSMIKENKIKLSK